MSAPSPKLKDSPAAPSVTGRRAFTALAIAVGADLLQLMLVPVAWTFSQAAIDVVAMLLVLPLLGFHVLLLPTFLLEFMPGVNWLPTWTGCVLAVIALRRRATETTSPTAPPPVIDVDEINKPPRLDRPN